MRVASSVLGSGILGDKSTGKYCIRALDQSKLASTSSMTRWNKSSGTYRLKTTPTSAAIYILSGNEREHSESHSLSLFNRYRTICMYHPPRARLYIIPL